MIRSIEQIKECPDCASSNIVHNVEREQVICRECGLIYEPLTPAEEETYEQAHDLTMRGISRARPAVKAAKAKTAKAKPAKKRKK